MAHINHALLTLVLAVSSITAQSLTITAPPSSTTAQPSTTICTPRPCYQDNVYRDLIRATEFCASFTAPPQPGATTAPLPDPVKEYYSSLSSACSCLYPSGATTVVTLPSITQCATVPLAPSPTPWRVDFEPGSPTTLNVTEEIRVENVSIIADRKNSFSKSSLRVNFTLEEPGSSFGHLIEFSATGLMRPYTNYTFIFWAKEDHIEGMGSRFNDIQVSIQGLKKGPVPPNGALTENPSTFSVNRPYLPWVDSQWLHYDSTFNSGEYPYFYIHFSFYNHGTTQSGIIPSLWLDNVYLKEGEWDPGAEFRI
ncbi:hypothetical protein F5Y14DRAFT_424143 [Nemania sp. NC0429]|nr:hypothetical protein F5Y14DRAFT_424143 [Nemania sp. NC0429]